MCMLCYVYIYSESSGDSILIGVENDLDFKNYKPSGNRIVLETSSMPYQNISHRNQLLDDGPEPESDCYPITPPLFYHGQLPLNDLLLHFQSSS